MKKAKLKKSISVVLCLCLMAAVFGVQPVSAMESGDTLELPQPIAASLLPEELKKAIDLDLTKTESAENPQNDESNVLILNHKDNTKTMYSFEAPIKYEKDGETKFINTKIENAGLLSGQFGKYSYQNTENSTEGYFPKHIDSGLLLKNNTADIELIPQTEANAAAIKTTNTFLGEPQTVIRYENAFGEGMHLEYAAIAQGVKENIYMESYTDKNTFSFTIKTDLIPKNTSGQTIEFTKAGSDKIAAVIDQPFAKDSYTGDNPNGDMHLSINCSYTVTPAADGEYLLTMIIDKDFLESDTTVYPILIDPTLTIKDIPAQKIIYSTSAYSASTSFNGYSSAYNMVGKHGSMGEAISYIKCVIPQRMAIIQANDIISAYYKVYEGSGTTHSSKIDLYKANRADWAVGNLTYSYSKKPGTDGGAVTSQTITSSKWVEFDITGMTKQWVRTLTNEGGYSCNYGFILKANNASAASKHFCSHTNTGYPPSLVVSYSIPNPNEGTYYIKSLNSGKYLTYNTSTGAITQSDFSDSSTKKWNINYFTSGTELMSIRSAASSSGYVSKGGHITGQNNLVDAVGDSAAMPLFIVRNVDGTYRILVDALLEMEQPHWFGLDVYNASTASGANVCFFTYKGYSHQKWILQDVNSGIVTQTFRGSHPNIVHADFDGSATHISYANVAIQIAYTPQNSQKYIRTVTTSVSAPQVQADWAITNHLQASYLNCSINNNISFEKSYLESTELFSPFTTFTALHTRNAAFTAPYIICKYQVKNVAYTNPPPVLQSNMQL